MAGSPMADVAAQSPFQPSKPRPIQGGGLKIQPPTSTGPLPEPIQSLRSGHLTLDTFSPVNQNGSFEFDRVIKSGQVQKRTRKTKSWKTVYLVLRPNLLSIYRDIEETKLRHQITLSDLTAVARQKDPKGRAKHVFGLFSPSRNFHLEASSEREAQEWVELIRREARIDEDEEEMVLASPGGARSAYHGFERHYNGSLQARMEDRNAQGYSSSDAEPFLSSAPSRRGPMSQLHSMRRPSHTLDYSGPEHASYSEFSDSAGARMSALSLTSMQTPTSVPTVNASQAHSIYGASPRPPIEQRNPSQMSNLDLQEQRPAPHPPHDEERVVRQGWVLLLKSKTGVRQWKKLWMVLRPKSLALYKNEEEYSAILVMPFNTIINAVDIDPISRSKRYCIQIISEERNYRLCAPDEDALARWLGAFKSLLVKRKEAEQQRQARITE